jgi:hypothetical protein
MSPQCNGMTQIFNYMLNKDRFVVVSLFEKVTARSSFKHFSSAVDREFKHGLIKLKTYKIGICYFSTKHAALRSNNRLVSSESG